MRPKWVIENFSSGSDISDLIKEVRVLGLECQVIDASTGFEYAHVQYKNECVVFYGSIQMTRLIQKHLTTCFPVAWQGVDTYQCSVYFPRVRDFLFNDCGQFMTIAELQEQKFDIYRKYGKECMIFVRPDDGDKSFSGALLDLQDFDRFWKNAVVCNAKPTDLVYVSTPKTINGEWRFTLDRYNGIITYSTYRYQGQSCLIPSAPQGAINLAQEIWSRGWHPDSVYCMDIAEDADGKCWLLEYNSWCSAGMYEGNKLKIAKRISEVAEMEYAQKFEV